MTIWIILYFVCATLAFGMWLPDKKETDFRLWMVTGIGALVWPVMLLIAIGFKLQQMADKHDKESTK